MSRSKAKTKFFFIFFDAKVVSHHQLVPVVQGVTGTFYMKVLKIMKSSVNRLRPGIAANKKLHHDNAQSNTCFVFNGYLARNDIAKLHQQPYRPDLAPADFFLVP